MSSMEEIYQNLQTILDEGELLLDVRRHDEFVQGHIDGALNIPHSEIQASQIEKLQTYKRGYVFCLKGGRACMAADSLKAFGLGNFTCIDENGMEFWLAKGYPIVRYSNPSPRSPPLSLPSIGALAWLPLENYRAEMETFLKL